MLRTRALCLLLLVATPTMGEAQGRTLTKDETVNYIERKVKESTGHYRAAATENGTRIYFYDFSIQLRDCQLTTLTTYGTYPTAADGWGKKDFNKMYFKTVSRPALYLSYYQAPNRASSDLIGVLRARLGGNTALSVLWQEYYHRVRTNSQGRDEYLDFNEDERTQTSVSETGFAFLQSDLSNFEKLKRALAHLSTLCKAEDDPFAPA